MNFASFSQALVRDRPRASGGLIALEQVDSTQLLARRIVEEYAREGALAPATDIVAWCQLAGRGRHGRTWSSPAGCGIYVTLIRSRPGADWLQTLPLRTAVALCRALNALLADRCRVKWPNDLLVGRRKLGGILIDAVTEGRRGSVATISFGVNHGGDPAALGEARATSLCREMSGADAGEVPPLPRLALELIRALDAELDQAASAAEIAGRYQELSAHRPGDELRCRLAGEVLVGEFRGFDERGFLRLGVVGEELLVSAGEILNDGGG